MSPLSVVLADLDTSEEIFRTVREVLGDRYHLRTVEAGADAGADLRTEDLVRALQAEPEDGRTVAVVVCVPAPGSSLEALVKRVRHLSPELPILAITRCHERKALVDLLASGVDEVCTHPEDGGVILARLWRLTGDAPPGEIPRRLREKVALRNLVGRSPGFLEVLRRIPLIAQVDSTVLVTGETGTGKEMVARAIHHLSVRSSRPFVPVNCGALPLDLVENELFGHERAAFTGADRARPGLIAEAEGGTLLLDEVDTLPPAAQAKLLRFLQEREYRRLGSARVHQADVRILAATNTRVDRAIAEGRFRRDLYYRLNILPLHLPALSERRDDIPLLARHFLAKHSRALGRSCPALLAEAVESLRARDWPGNVRQLSHLMERAVVMADGRGVLRSADLWPARLAASDTVPGGGLSFAEAKRRVVQRFEREYLQEMLRLHRGNITRASKAARKNRRAFWELLRKHQIDAELFRDG